MKRFIVCSFLLVILSCRSTKPKQVICGGVPFSLPTEKESIKKAFTINDTTQCFLITEITEKDEKRVADAAFVLVKLISANGDSTIYKTDIEGRIAFKIKPGMYAITISQLPIYKVDTTFKIEAGLIASIKACINLENNKISSFEIKPRDYKIKDLFK
jgi:hypothetical protein